MSDNSADAVFHSNRYTAESACEHCGGIVRHEPWCITVDRIVYYAFEIVADPSKLTVGDSLILHSLGVNWATNKCLGICKTNRFAAECVEVRSSLTPIQWYPAAWK